MSEARAPAVMWVLGSDSDLPWIEPGLEQLRELGITFGVRILSAHRTPDEVAELTRTARQDGVRVLVGVAGGAAHLPGVLAAGTTLPVIGVPVPSELAGGLDSLLSIAQMPSGVPVATVSANKAGGRNAALLAARILALSEPRLAEALVDHRRRMASGVLAKDRDVSRRYATP